MTAPVGRKLLTAACTALIVLGSTLFTEQETATAAPHAADRGELLSTQHLYTLKTPEEVKDALGNIGFHTTAVQHGVDTYRLVYRTIDAHGQPTTASGLVAVPHGHTGTLKPVSYTHGSELTAAHAPSTDPRGFTAAGTLTYASAGFAGIAPDYLGLGTGPGHHPWHDVPSEATATLDMLRAARQFMPAIDRELAPELLATGFSQGAGAVLGLSRALQEQHDPWFTLQATAAVSGAYHLRDVQIPAMFSGDLDEKTNVLNAAYAYTAFDRTYDVYDAPTDVFEPQYAEAVEELTDGTHTWQDLAAATPATLDELLTDHGVDLLLHPEGRMATALEASDQSCKGWKPKTPTRLYYTADDEQAPKANTTQCRASFAAHGADVPTIDVQAEPLNDSLHFGSHVAATDRILTWFQSFERCTPHPRTNTTN